MPKIPNSKQKMNLAKYSKLFRSFLIVILILSNGACNFNPNSLDSLTWKVDLLGPLVKTEISLEEILQFEDVRLPIEFSMSYLDSNFINDITVNSFPPITIAELDPPQKFTASDFFNSVTFDSGEMYYVITNNSPFTIEKGGILVIRNSSDLSEVLSDSIKSDILPDSVYTMDPKLNLAEKTVESSLEITIKDLKTKAITTPTLIKSTDNISIEFNIIKIKIKQVVVNPNIFVVSDTTNINLQGDIVETNVVDGTLINYINNDLPIRVDTLKATFLDQNLMELFPLFNSNISIEASDSTKIIIDSLGTKFPQINKAKFLYTYVRFNLPVTSTFKKENSVKLQIVGDLKVKLN